MRLAISRVDPWSVMKLSFLLSVAIGVMIVVAAAVVWFTLNGLHVFTKVDDLVTQITGAEGAIDILQYVEFQRVISGATLIAVIDVFLLTALADHRRVPLQHRGGARRRRARDDDRRVRAAGLGGAPALG